MPSNNIILLVIILVACLTGIASDIYAPSIPAIASDLGIPIDDVQFSMAIFMFGISLSQLVYGPLSEGIGRKVPLLVGLVIATLGSLICLTASTITILIVGRFIQGVGAGAGASLWRSIFRDCFKGHQMVKYGAYLSIIATFIVPAAPTLGGYLQTYGGWRSNFIFLLGYCIVAFLIVAVIFKETNVHHHKDRLTFRFYKKSFGQLLTSPIFMGYCLCTFLCYGAFFSWFVVGPVLLIKIIGLTPVEFGWITLFVGGGSMALASLINGKLVTRLGSHFMLRCGWSLMIIAGVLMLSLKFTCGINAYIIVGPIALLYFGSTFIWPSAFAGAFAPFGKIAGYAGALYSFMQIGGAALMGALIAFLPDTDQVPLSLIFIIAPILAWVIFEKIIIPQEKLIAQS